MRLLSFLSQFLFLSILPRRLLNNTSQISASPFSNHTVFSLTRHTQVLSAPKTRDLSTTMLATMPCTAFPGRTVYGFESVVTRDFPGSTVKYVYSQILRERPERRMPVSTVEGKGRGMNRVEIVVVVEWAVISFEGG